MKILQVDKTIEADPELNDSDGFVTTHKLTSSWIPAFAGMTNYLPSQQNKLRF